MHLGTETAKFYNCAGSLTLLDPGDNTGTIEEYCDSAYQINVFAVPVVVDTARAPTT